MKVWEQLTFWTNDSLIGVVSAELLALARQHGEPSAPQGVPLEQAIPLVYPAISDDHPEIEQLLRRVAIVLQAVDRHPYWHRGVMVINKPFTVVPDWAVDIPGVQIEPNWMRYLEEATAVVEAFLAGLSRYGIHQAPPDPLHST